MRRLVPDACWLAPASMPSTMCAVVSESRSFRITPRAPTIQTPGPARTQDFYVAETLGQGKLSGKKINNQWRIPLKAVL